MGFREPEFPGSSRVFERRQRARAGSTVVTRNEDDIGLGLGDTGGDGSHPRFRNELDVNSGRRVRPLEIKDQLLEIFDRINVVVRGRGNETHSWGAHTCRRDPGVHLVGRQLAALPWFRTLSHLDLNVIRVSEVHARHPKTATRDLLDRASAFGVQKPVDGLAALSRV